MFVCVNTAERKQNGSQMRPLLVETQKNSVVLTKQKRFCAKDDESDEDDTMVSRWNKGHPLLFCGTEWQRFDCVQKGGGGGGGEGRQLCGFIKTRH